MNKILIILVFLQLIINNMYPQYKITSSEENLKLIEEKNIKFVKEIRFNKSYCFLRTDSTYLIVPPAYGKYNGIIISSEAEMLKMINEEHFPIPIDSNDLYEVHKKMVINIFNIENQMIDTFEKENSIVIDSSRELLNTLDSIIKRDLIADKPTDIYFMQCIAVFGKIFKLKYGAKLGLIKSYEKLNPTFKPILILNNNKYIYTVDLLMDYATSQTKLGIDIFLDMKHRHSFSIPEEAKDDYFIFLE